MTPLSERFQLTKEAYSKTQVNVTDIDVDNGELRGHISTFRASNVAKGRGKNRVQSGVNQITKQSLCDFAKNRLIKTLKSRKTKTSGIYPDTDFHWFIHFSQTNFH